MSCKNKIKQLLCYAGLGIVWVVLLGRCDIEAGGPGWKARILADDSLPGKDVPVLRTNRVMRGVPLPAGEHHVVLTYEPTSYVIGSWISAAAWITTLIALGAMCIAKRRRSSN